MTFVVVAFTGTASWNLSSYAIGSSDMDRELGFSTVSSVPFLPAFLGCAPLSPASL
jgi:hypothetical protein